MLLAASPLIDVVPGLMIWTLVCFAITFFVLRKFAFGPIQKTIDERRDRIRSAVEEAENARAEARRLLEEHKELIGQAKGEAGEILAEARKIADSQRERAKEEIEADRQRRLEETRKQIEAETVRALEQIRAEVAELALAATAKVTGKVLDRDDHRKLIEDAIGDLDFSVCWSGLVAVAARLYARSLFEAAKEEKRLEPVLEELGDFVAALEQVPELRSLLTNPELDPAERAAALDEILGGADELIRNFLRLLSEKGRTAQIDEIYRELEELVAADAEAADRRADDGVRALRGRSRSIMKKIEKSSGRSVEATRKVDSALIGGIILQVGSRRLDASVRGRINRLRHELVTRS